ncbi:MAG: protease modulator HflK [Paracoccaceae bacterium]|nr:protease modulator HflK [Paracoccaceae bacterium]
MPEPLPSETIASSTRIIHTAFDWYRGRQVQFLGCLAGLAILLYLGSGIYIVKKEEQAVLTRFGKVINAEVLPGIHYAIPLVDKAHIRKVTRIMRHNVATKGDDGQVEFSILSGDANLFEADVALQYKIGNLRNYLYETTDPELVLTLTVREFLIDSMGQNFIDLIFTSNRDIIQTQLFEDTKTYLANHDIGIELLALNIVDLRPIEETVPAFRDVSDAIAESIQAVSDANRRTERLLARSRGQAQAVVVNARAKARERKLQAASNAEVFGDLLAAYREQPSSVTVTRYWQRMRSIFRDATVSAVNSGDATTTIDINMVEGFVPGVGRVPTVPTAAAPDRATLAGSRLALTEASEQGSHGYEQVKIDRALVDGRFHDTRAERHHMNAASLRSLIFDDLSIFGHRHVVKSSVAIAAEQQEPPLVQKTVVVEEDDATGTGVAAKETEIPEGGDGQGE